MHTCNLAPELHQFIHQNYPVLQNAAKFFDKREGPNLQHAAANNLQHSVELTPSIQRYAYSLHDLLTEKSCVEPLKENLNVYSQWVPDTSLEEGMELLSSNYLRALTE